MNQTMTLETITPEMAEGFLRVNKNVRTVNQREVTRLAGILLRGRWSHANGDAIRFDHDGNLVDGQHRLFAIIQSGVPMTTWVCRGIDPKAVIDTGRRRTRAVQTCTERPDLPCVYINNSVASGIAFLTSFGESATKRSYISQDQIYDYIDAYRRELDELLEVETAHKARTATVVAATFSAYMSGVGLDVIGAFYDALKDGMVSDDRLFPAIAYRNYLMESGKKNSITGERYKRCQYAIKCCDDNLRSAYVKKKKHKSIVPPEFVYPFPPFPREQDKGW